MSDIFFIWIILGELKLLYNVCVHSIIEHGSFEIRNSDSLFPCTYKLLKFNDFKRNSLSIFEFYFKVLHYSSFR